MVVADEAHFLRNPLAYWGMLMAELGTHTSRMILATGTPFVRGSGARTQG